MRVGGKAFRSIWLGDDGVCVEIDQTLLPHEPAEILGDAGSVVTFIMTVTIITFMPSGWAESAGGFPAMTGNIPFLMKDVVLLAASIYLLKQDVVRIGRR